MNMLRNWEGLNWPVHRNYSYEKKDNEDYIFFNGSAKTFYNPTADEDKVPIFTRFIYLKKTKKDIYNFVKKFGLLWTDGYKKNKFGIYDGESLNAIYNEINTINKTFEIFLALQNKNIEKLKVLILLNEINDKDEIIKKKDNTDLIIGVKTGIKYEPIIQLLVDRNIGIVDEVYLFAATTYLIELISDRIRDEGGVLPYYSKIYKDYSKYFAAYSIIPCLESKNLAGAIWLQFYNILISNQKLTKCKNENCNNPPFTKDGKREYCSDKCRRAQMMRGRRINNKKKKLLLIKKIIFILNCIKNNKATINRS